MIFTHRYEALSPLWYFQTERGGGVSIPCSPYKCIQKRPIVAPVLLSES